MQKTLVFEAMIAKNPKNRSPRTWREYLSKYLMEGQTLQKESAEEKVEIGEDRWDRFTEKYRKYIAFLIPFVTFQTLWWMTAVRHDFFSLYKITWPVMLTSTVACTVAGMTAEGAGAVFFPVMTLLMHIDTDVSRDFSVMCQSFGMPCALFVIIFSGVKIETRAILLSTISGVPGMILGFELFDKILDGPTKKMIFVSAWGSFAIALYMLNAEKKRKTYTRIPEFKIWKAFVLLGCGFIGGIFTALTGSGLDVATFSILTSLFRISEKIATPTTVTLMGINTVFAFFYRAVIHNNISVEAWQYCFSVIPICTTFAPLGATIGTHFHRQVLACLLYILEGVSVIGFLLSKPGIWLLLAALGIVAFGFVFFQTLCKLGYKLMDQVEKSMAENRAKRLNPDLEGEMTKVPLVQKS